MITLGIGGMLLNFVKEAVARKTKCSSFSIDERSCDSSISIGMYRSGTHFDRMPVKLYPALRNALFGLLGLLFAGMPTRIAQREVKTSATRITCISQDSQQREKIE